MRIILLFCLSVLSSPLFSQIEFDGLWEGAMTVGGLSSTQEYPIQVYLKKSAWKVSGRSYVSMPDGRIIEMKLEGRMYDDLSVYIDEVHYVEQQDDGYVPPFLRKYQLSWNRSIGGSTINGYWQEIKQGVFDLKRERGRIYLKKVAKYKA